MSRVLVDQLIVLAERLSGGSIAGRPDLTRKFWLIARQLRSGLPPLLVPVRTGSPQHRIGYLLAGYEGWADRIGLIEREHAYSTEQVILFLRGDFRGAAPAEWAKVVDLNPLNDIQAARLVAEFDLDALADIDGGMLRAMPLLIALHPGRKVVEAAFVPPVSRDSNVTGDRLTLLPLVEAIHAARDALGALPASASPALEPPSILNGLLNRAIQMHQSGDLDAAREAYEEVLNRYPRHPIAAYLLGQLLHQQHQSQQAIRLLQEATTAAPEFRDAHYTLAQRLSEADRWQEAIASYRRSVDLTPGFAAGWSGLGLASLHGPSSARAAIGHLERAVALEPDSPQWAFNLGTGWQRQGNLPAARDAYLRALRLDPAQLEARFNLGAVAQDMGDLPAAIEAYRAVLAHQPKFASVYPQLGACVLQAGDIEAWIDNFRLYRAECPESLSMAVYGLEASAALGDPQGYASWRDRILAGDFPSADPEDFTRNWEQLFFLLLHVDLDRGTLLQWYRSYDKVATAWYGAPVPARSARRAGPMRVGYLSGDLRDHVMGRMIFELVSRHDRTRFQPYLYALSAASDSFTEAFKKLDLPFIELAHMPHASAAARIRDDDLDVLVDCSGHTRGAQQGILALKPARVVATHIATPGPVGLHAIDYKLTDEFAESPDAQDFLLERLWPVPGGVFPWHRYPQPADAARNALGLRPDAFVCGAFVSLMKLSPRCLDLWRTILGRLPEAILALSPPTDSWRASYVRWLSAHGIAEERIAFIPYHKDEAAALARYRVLDVALDPMPCGNVNGTMEALAMGVPVVTLMGARHGERLGNALLRRFGVTDTIADDEDAYASLVVRLARDRAWAAALRDRIRAAAIGSPAWDSESRVRAHEASFARMVEAREPQGAA